MPTEPPACGKPWPLRLIASLLAQPGEPRHSACHLWGFVLVFLLPLCSVVFFTGAVPTRQFGHDIFFLLDNGWRVLNGQRPHLDFGSQWGPVTFLLIACGLKISAYSVDGVGHATAIAGLVIGAWSYWLGRNRLEVFPRILVSVFLTLLSVAPYPLGFSAVMSSHAMVYNRYAYAILGLILVEVLQPPRDANPRSEWAGALSSGAAAALLLFLKASYFSVALVLIASSFALGNRTLRRCLGMAAGFSLIAIPLLAYLRFDVAAIVSDLRMAAGARLTNVSSMDIRWNLKIHSNSLLSAVLLGSAASLGADAAGPLFAVFRLPLYAAVVYGCDIALLSSNNQGDALPLVAFFGLLVLNTVATQYRAEQGDSRASLLYPAAVALFAATFFLPQMSADCLGVVYGAWKKAHPTRVAIRFEEPRLAPLLLYDAPYHGSSNGGEYTTYVNDGVRLLRQVSGPQETVMTMDLTNPFSYALGRKPPSGGLAAVAYNSMLSEAYHQADDKYFGNANIVMIPKRPALGEENFAGVYRLYQKGLHDRFALAAESDWFYLYRLKGSY